MFSTVLVTAAGVFGIVGLIVVLGKMIRFPRRVDLARAQAAARGGILYAFTLGMLPWEKPGRSLKFWIGYIRGIVFHVGAFTGLATLAMSPWLAGLWTWLRILFAVSVGLGLLAAVLGLLTRAFDGELRGLSIPDDYVSLALVVLFLGGALLALTSPSRMALFYILSSPMLLYIPFGKIRHCVYFFFSRFYYGDALGRLGMLEHHTGD